MEGYCVQFAYLLNNCNLLIRPILFGTMPLCSYQKNTIKNCPHALFQSELKLHRLAAQSIHTYLQITQMRIITLYFKY